MSKEHTMYEIHDNGGRPFFVSIDGSSVEVFKNMNTYERIDNRFVEIVKLPKLLFKVDADEVFIGKKSPKGGYDGLPPREAIGNSILLRDGKKYIYIGHTIYEFVLKKDDTILEYYSDIGPNDVPYPYAVGKTHIYILLDGDAVEKSYFDMSKPIYEQYYYTHRIEMCLFGNPRTDLCKDKSVYEPKLKEFKEKTTKLKRKVLHKRR